MTGVKHFREQAENELLLESKMYLKEMLYGKMREKSTCPGDCHLHVSTGTI